ncbi:c0105f1e-1f1f-4cef-afc8-7fdb8dec0c56 [Sclerotinia trifoliorum]|uniref:C0105f1e-1f1f-4cef-afc8-7fdb8dec0c56 n=1 Tax=Sclerotinia trifoliorum TaxID=28548 RepID=A0A8H2W6Q0_9HELO|nr:c0105f1e-1f1f-4cef-afc8-7fdb8dec0c56 [Sclerotinia trifoliorum]
MLSLRTLTRSAPRVARNLSTAAIRTATRPSLLQTAFPASRLQCASAFSTSSIRNKSAAPESDAELVEKLASEIQMEDDMKAQEEIPTSVKDYMENGPFEILDTPGQEEVVLTRSFGDEKIRVTFSIADLNAYDPEADDFQDRGLVDEEDLDPSKPEDVNETEDASSNSDETQGFPARVNIIVEKKNKGALAIETVAEDGMIVVDNVYYYSDASHAYAKTTEAAHQRQDLYVGPPYGNLDEDLQVLLERYLDERGINQALAIFVPDYIDMKEQKEYLRWLKNVKGFIAA